MDEWAATSGARPCCESHDAENVEQLREKKIKHGDRTEGVRLRVRTTGSTVQMHSSCGGAERERR